MSTPSLSEQIAAETKALIASGVPAIFARETAFDRIAEREHERIDRERIERRLLGPPKHPQGDGTSQVAERLGISRKTAHRYLRQYGLKPDRKLRRFVLNGDQAEMVFRVFAKRSRRRPALARGEQAA